MTPGEFKKFAHAIRNVRKFRHAFCESTGERKPYRDRYYETRWVLAIAALGLLAFTSAFWWVTNNRTADSTTAGVSEPAAKGVALPKPESWSKFAPASVTDVSLVSESDPLISIGSGTSDASLWRVPAPVQTSIEQAIWDGMDNTFSRPEEVFKTIKAPEISIE